MKANYNQRLTGIAMLVAFFVLGAARLTAQVGINRQTDNTALLVGNQVVTPLDTVFAVLSDTQAVYFSIQKDGAILMPYLPPDSTQVAFLVRDSTGRIGRRTVPESVLDGSDDDWLVRSDALLSYPDSNLTIRKGATVSPIVEITAPSVPSAGESFLKCSMPLAPDDYLLFHSGTSANTCLMPRVMGHVAGCNGMALSLSGQITSANDNGTAPVVGFDARKGSWNVVYTRPLFQWTSAYNIYMTMAANGYLGIGTTSPTAQLEITGDAKKPGSIYWTTSSDRRLKKNVRPFQVGLEALMAINPVWYEYNGLAGTPTDQEFVGIIAQEMQEVFPHSIREFDYVDEAGETSTFLEYDATATTFIMINAIQEQQKIIEEQKAALDRMGKQLAFLEARVESLLEPKHARPAERIGLEVTPQTAER